MTARIWRNLSLTIEKVGMDQQLMNQHVQVIFVMHSGHIGISHSGKVSQFFCSYF